MPNLYRDGQQVTVIDAKEVRGPGVIRGVDQVMVMFDHHSRRSPTKFTRWASGEFWFLGALANVGMAVEPFTEEAPAPAMGNPITEQLQSADPRDAEIARLREAWLAGFMSSAEGYNGEYPFDGEPSPQLDVLAEAYIAALSTPSPRVSVEEIAEALRALQFVFLLTAAKFEFDVQDSAAYRDAEEVLARLSPAQEAK